MAKPTTNMAATLAMIITLPLFLLPASATSAAAEETKNQAVYSEEAFLDAALTSCVQSGRSSRVCSCELKLLSDETAIKNKEDRLTTEDKEMAFFFYVDKARFKKEAEEKRTTNPKWAANFSRKMTHLQALVITACGLER